mmetsp:Transcript_41365/g.74394  ORF Transcript_41365/g.74394 Transcript_41365/m.74394 type:complete len:88 (+) Transcript_41365:10-273(+)
MLRCPSSRCFLRRPLFFLPPTFRLPSTSSPHHPTNRRAPTPRGTTTKLYVTATSLAMPIKSNSVLWFRKGLRLHDNPALLEAIDGVQ